MEIYDVDFSSPGGRTPLPVTVFETDIDLYYDMALSMYAEIRENNSNRKDTVIILPVGPVFQYRRFVKLCGIMPIDLSRVYCFFMDEYLDEGGGLIDAESPLSFRGFIQREFLEKVPEDLNLAQGRIIFPDPKNPAAFDELLESLGGADTCYAGVGINGHLAFNEPEEGVSVEEFAERPTRVIELTRETITINSNTAMRGAFERIPPRAITVGMKQILAAKKLRVYLNRPWQSSVVRKLLFSPVSSSFPATMARNHPDAAIGITETVAMKPEFALK